MAWDPDTTMMGEGESRFPTTRHSVLDLLAEDGDQRAIALDLTVGAYWKPIYKYLRWKWGVGNEQAKDWVQGFFASLIERRLIEKFDSTRASFRTYLRLCVDGYVAHELESGGRLKRGGSKRELPLDFEQADRELARTGPAASVEDAYHREWQRELMLAAIEDMKQELDRSGRGIVARIWEAYDLWDPGIGERPTYQELAERFAVPATTVTNHLALARRLLRQTVAARLASITVNQREFEQEYRGLIR